MESSLLFNIATLAYLVAMVLYISYLAFRKDAIGKIASIVTSSGLVVQTIALFLRWRESYQMDIGRVPLSNLYESLVFFTWSTVLIYLIVEYKYKTRAFGAFVLPVAFLALAFINVAGISKDITPLVPALKSNWLFYHVLISFLGYAAFGVAFAISMIYLLMDTEERGPVAQPLAGHRRDRRSCPRSGISWQAMGERHEDRVLDGARRAGPRLVHLSDLVRGEAQVPGISVLVALRDHDDQSARGHGHRFRIPCRSTPLPRASHSRSTCSKQRSSIHSAPMALVSWAVVLVLFWLIWSQGMGLKNLLKQYMPALDHLDDVTYRMIAIGWPLLTGGIITGAVWANSAWGTYWSWDPKETWSLITWFVYAIYLHARYVRGWKGTQMAVISAVGFLAVIFTYLGVNLVLSGLHSYGGLN